MKTRVLSIFLSLTISAFLGGCASVSDMNNAKSDVATLKAQLAKLEERYQRTETRVDGFKGLSADVEAVRTYFLDVKNTVKQMRDDTVRILDEQRVAIDQSRKTYLKLLKNQQEMLDKVIKDMDKFLADTDTGVAREPAPATKISGTEPSTPAPAAKPAPAPAPATEPKAAAPGGLPSGIKPGDWPK